MKTLYFLLGSLVILATTISIVIGIKLYQGISPQIVAEGFKTITFTMYVIGLILIGGFLVGSSVFLTLQWSAKLKDQNNELITTMTQAITKKQDPILPPQNVTLNIKGTESRILTLSSEEEEKEKEKLSYNNKKGIY